MNWDILIIKVASYLIIALLFYEAGYIHANLSAVKRLTVKMESKIKIK